MNYYDRCKCGSRKKTSSIMCGACRQMEQREKAAKLTNCEICGGPKVSVKAKICRSCCLKKLAAEQTAKKVEWHCKLCGKKIRKEATHCIKCAITLRLDICKCGKRMKKGASECGTCKSLTEPCECGGRKSRGSVSCKECFEKRHSLIRLTKPKKEYRCKCGAKISKGSITCFPCHQKYLAQTKAAPKAKPSETNHCKPIEYWWCKGTEGIDGKHPAPCHNKNRCRVGEQCKECFALDTIGRLPSQENFIYYDRMLNVV